SIVCPSDEEQGSHFVHPEFTNGKHFGKGNYAAYASLMHTDLQLLYPAAMISTGQKLSKILDGASNTIVLAEVRTLNKPTDERGAWALPWNAATLLSLDLHTYTNTLHVVDGT